mmetsp:Transcript_11702/g.27086  ORF Transcript_11702/g.27086 Transcript_11702/m.27086 type:complete len:115 (+) Transcript_11702:633-977(+)
MLEVQRGGSDMTCHWANRSFQNEGQLVLVFGFGTIIEGTALWYEIQEVVRRLTSQTAVCWIFLFGTGAVDCGCRAWLDGMAIPVKRVRPAPVGVNECESKYSLTPRFKQAPRGS